MFDTMSVDFRSYDILCNMGYWNVYNVSSTSADLSIFLFATW